MRRALSVGIDNYPFGPLAGCVNDAHRICEALRTHENGDPNFDCRILEAPIGGPDNVVTRAALKAAVDQLLRHPAQLALFHFAGHGTVNNLDGYLVTQDAAAYDEGVPMSDVLKMANDSPVTEIIILIDCCFAGRFGNEPVIDNKKALLREGISVLTAARGDQPSVEAGGGGLFTSLVADALNGGAADLLGAVSGPSIYSFVEAALGAWDQRPLFKAHLSSVTPIKHCEPPIPRRTLRELPRLFPLPAEDFPLDPSYEPHAPAPDAGNCAKFEQLQQLHRVHLLVPVDAPHMYDAAMGSKACRLTATGRYYWRLASAGKI